MSAKEAYKAYVRAYDSHHLKTIFDVNTLDVTKVALSFGFTVPPAVDLLSKTKQNRPEKRRGGGGLGYYKNMNNPSGGNRMEKTRTYRQPKPKYQGGREGRQFSR